LQALINAVSTRSPQLTRGLSQSVSLVCSSI